VPKKRFGIDVGRVLEVAEEIPIADALIESPGEPFRARHFHDAFDLAARRQAQPHGGDHAKQAVPAERQLEQFRILAAAAPKHLTARIDQRERFDVLRDWGVGETASVRVGGERAAETETVGARLLLHDPPLPRLSLLAFEERGHERRPLDTGAHLDVSSTGVELEDGVKAAHVHVHRVGAELLAAHCVPAPGDRQGPVFAGSAPHDVGKRVDGRGLFDTQHPCPVELRMDVVEPDTVAATLVAAHSGAPGGPCRRRNSGPRRPYEQFTPRQHGDLLPAQGDRGTPRTRARAQPPGRGDRARCD
jgi:hypothetical protein